MTRSVYTIDLDDEEANYTIGQLLTHLQLAFDKSEYEKVGKLLRRREELIRGEMLGEMERLKVEAWKEMEVEVEKVKRVGKVREVEISRGFLAEMEEMRRGLKAVEDMFEELVKWKVEVEESFEKVEKENLRLKKKIRVLSEINEELKKREEAEKVRVLELEMKVEVEESLRVRAEEDQEEGSDQRFKKLESRISMLENRNKKLMISAGLDFCRIGRVVRTTSLMEAADCAIGNVVDLTEEADGVFSGDTLTGNLMEDSTSLHPANFNKSGPRTKVKTESRDPISKASAPRTTGVNHVKHESGSVVHIPGDSEDDTSDYSPLRFKRRRTRSLNKEILRQHESSNSKGTSQQSPSIRVYERTPASSVFVKNQWPE